MYAHPHVAIKMYLRHCEGDVLNRGHALGIRVRVVLGREDLAQTVDHEGRQG